MTVADSHLELDALLAAERPVEPSGSLRFGSRGSRDAHVRKHVLGARSERWWDLLGQELVAGGRAADHEQGDGGRDPRFERLARAYESLLADRLQAAIRAGRHHVHLVTFELVSAASVSEAMRGLAYRTSRRLVVAWAPEEKIRIVAGFSVSEEGVAAYTLWSGFRHDVKASVGRFNRGIRSRMLDRHRHHQERLVAIHDGETDWGPESPR